MGRKLQWLELTLAGAKRYSHKERKKKQVVLFSTHPSRLAQTFIHGFCHHPFCWAEPHFLWVHWSKKSASGAQWLQDSEVPRVPAVTMNRQKLAAGGRFLASFLKQEVFLHLTLW